MAYLSDHICHRSTFKRNLKRKKMNKEIIQEKLMKIIDDIFRIHGDIKNCDKFQDIGIDTLDKVELVMECENVFNISISDDDWQNINSIDDIINYLYKRLNNV